MNDMNQVIELVGEEVVTDAEKLLEFIIDNDCGEEFVRWCNCNK